MPKLNDTQLMLLAHAAPQECGNFHPLPAALIKNGVAVPRASKATDELAACGFVEERETSAAGQICRTDGDLNYGWFITEAGLHAIGIDVDGDATLRIGLGMGSATPQPPEPAVRQTKAGMLLALLQREEGANLDELIAATGWLPHTTRAALTGLRKKGHTIEKSKRGEAICYKAVAA